jgi:hypothetical protein
MTPRDGVLDSRESSTFLEMIAVLASGYPCGLIRGPA